MNIARKIILTGLATLLGIAVACGDDDGGPINANGPVGNNNTAGCAVDATFTSIYNNRLGSSTCATGGCHNAASMGAGLNFEKPQAEALADLVGATSSSEPPKIRVVAGDASQSYFFEKLTNPNVGGILGPMPVGGMLDQCEIDAIETWINAGAQNN